MSIFNSTLGNGASQTKLNLPKAVPVAQPFDITKLPGYVNPATVSSVAPNMTPIPAPKPTVVAQPKLPTAGQIYGTTQTPPPVVIPPATPKKVAFVAPQYDNDPIVAKAMKDAGKTATSNIDENSIRDYYNSLHQKEIDAVNQIYAGTLATAQQQGLGNLGSSTAISARSGTLGSPSGDAQYKDVQGQNLDVESGIRAEQATKIQQILGKASQEAVDEIKAKNDAKQKGLTDYISYLGSQTDRKTTATSNLAKSLIAQGLSTDDLSKDELSKLAKTYGVSTSDIVSSYQTEKQTKDAADAKAAEDGQFNLSEGQQRFDKDGKLIASVAKTYKPTTTASGATGTYTPGANPAVDAYISRINSGQDKFSSVPAALKNAVEIGLASSGNTADGKSTITPLGKQALTTAKSLLDKFNAGKGTSAVGTSNILDSFGYGLIPGTDRSDFITDFNTLKSQLALDGSKYLKGQGAVSEGERTLLDQATTKLNRTQSEEEFKSTLEGIVKTLSGAGEGNEDDSSGGSNIVTAPDGQDVEITD